MTGPQPAVARQGGGALTLAGWIAFLAAATAGLHALGGALAPPPLTDLGQLGGWLDQRQPAEAAFAVVRLVALGMSWYLLVVTVAGALARAAGWRSLVLALDAVTVPVVRRLVAGAAGASLAAAALTGGGASMAEGQAAAPPAPAAETMRRLPDAPPGTDPTAPVTTPPSTVSRAGGATGTVPVLRRLPATSPDSTPDPGEVPPSTPTPPADAPVIRRLPESLPDSTTTPAGDTATGTGATTPAAPPLSAPPSATARAIAAAPTPAAQGRPWQVVPGDHFWAVAERVLAEAWQRAPTDDEVDPYWRALVAANVAVLRDPGNPDLLFPGQVITVPAPPTLPGE